MGECVLISYNTVKNKASCEFTEKRSKFIGYINPVESEDEAIDFIKKIKSEHWNAKHNAYAYSIKENSISRFSDDGEPQGTAGMPIMEIINKNELTNVVIVVTRYFGGILLGTGGLVRCYSYAAKLAINSSTIIKKSFCKNFKLNCSYDSYGKITSSILSHKGVIKNVNYSDSVKIIFYIESDKFSSLKDSLNDITCGNLDIIFLEESFEII